MTDWKISSLFISCEKSHIIFKPVFFSADVFIFHTILSWKRKNIVLKFNFVKLSRISKNTFKRILLLHKNIIRLGSNPVVVTYKRNF